jgi:hypothetical protein
MVILKEKEKEKEKEGITVSDIDTTVILPAQELKLHPTFQA